MKNNFSIICVFLLALIFMTTNSVEAQSDGCSFATTISVGAIGSCTLTHGTTVGATQTIPGCSGTADDDVWYQFTATSTSMKIQVMGATGFDPVLQVFSGSCSVLNSNGCVDNTALGGTETYSATNFVVGDVYHVRVYSYGSGTSAEGEFDICVSEAATPPSNDDCAGATAITVNASCSYQTFDNSGATESMAGCAGTADDDVWFQFTATNAVQTITVDPSTVGSGLMDPVVELFQGSCGSLIQITCSDNTGIGQPEVINAVGLIPGQTYYFRVYDYYSNWYDQFNICVVGQPTPAPTNDDVCNAIQLPTVTSSCEYLQFNNVGATPTAGTPAPYIMSSTCETGSSTGYNASSTGDVWFAITVPASGDVFVTSEPNIGTGAITDGVMVLYTGSCSPAGSLTQVAYSNDYSCYPNGVTSPSMPIMPFISATGLTPGSTVYLRYYNWGASSQGTFGICVSTAENDECSNALYICDINGYKGSTGTFYSADRPDNMHGNNETSAGVDQTNGTNTGGPFGYYPPSNIPGPYSSPNIDVNINNNSWIRFTASSTTVVLNVDVYDCFNGNYPSGGIQMQIFSSVGCTNFSPVSSFEENSTGFTITASGLTVGEDYLLMIDGFAGDICSYTISADTGVQFPDIPDPAAVCAGEPVVLTAPATASSYQWDNGATTQSITIYPGSSKDVSCVVTGLCNYKQTLTAHVTVKPSPVLSFSTGSNPSICNGESITITAGGATSYSWNTSPVQTGSSITVSPTSDQSYVVTGNTSGCAATKTINVTVNPLPTVTLTAPNSTICEGDNVTISAGGTSGVTYAWDHGLGSGNSKNVSPSSSTTYNVTGTDGNGCTASQSISITVNANPTVTAGADQTICSGESASLSASGASTYTWDNGVGPGASPTVTPTSTTTYTVTGTSNGCSAQETQTITVNTTPVAPTATDQSFCGSKTIADLTASGSNIQWYSAATGGSPLSSSTSLTDGTTYYASQTSGTCESDLRTPVLVTLDSPADAGTISGPSSVCEGGTINLNASVIGGVWTSTNTSVATVSNSGVVSSISNGTTSISYTVSGSGACPDDATTYPITINALPTVSVAAAEPTICEGESTTLSASGSSGVTYSWDNGLPNGASNSVSPTATTTYTVTATDNTTSCAADDNITVTVNALPTISVAGTADPASCGGNGTIHLTFSNVADGNYTVTYSSGSFTNVNVTGGSATISAPAGTYADLSITNANSCASMSLPDVTLTDPSSPTAVANATQSAVCQGDNIQLNATTVSGATYAWSGPNGFTSTDQNPTISGVSTSADGTYILTVTSAGCTGTDNVAVTVNALPTVSVAAAEPTICEGESTTLSASGSSGVTYSWDNGLPNGASNSVSPTATTTYTVTATDNTTSCAADDNITVTVNALPTISVAGTADPASCGGNGTIHLTFSNVADGNYTVTYSSGSFTNVNVTGGSATISAPAGTYANLSITNANSCASMSLPDVTLTDPNLPSLDAGQNQTVCAGEDVTLTASNPDGATITWNNGINDAQPFIPPSGTSDTSITYIVSGNLLSCVAMDSVTIFIHTLPSASFSGNNATLCMNDASPVITITGSNGTSPYTFNYTLNGGAPQSISSNGNTATIQVPTNASGVFNYHLTSVQDAGVPSCQDSIVSQDITITVNPLPNVDASVKNNKVCLNDPIKLTAQTNGGSIEWTGPNGFVSNDQNPVIEDASFDNSGSYILSVTDSNLCKNQQSIEVKVHACEIHIGEVVTPNGDAHNETFIIENIEGFPKTAVWIFDRWGIQVYQSDDYKNDWAGHSESKLTVGDGRLPEGTYYYLIKLGGDGPNKGKVYKGYLYLRWKK